MSAKGALALRGWLSRLGEVIGLNDIAIEVELTAPRTVKLNQPIGCVLYPPHEVEPLAPAVEAPIKPASESPAFDLAAPLPLNLQSTIQNQKSKVWRVVPQVKRPIGPAWVIGQLTHEALRRWRFPAADNFDVFLWPFALEAGLTDRAEIQATINEVRRLLRRFQTHPLCAEIEKADRWHEVPYALPGDSGVIDLLYRAGAEWTIVDFKTDEVRTITEMRETIEREQYAEQVRRYMDALTLQIGQRPRGRLVFLRLKNEVHVEQV